MRTKWFTFGPQLSQRFMYGVHVSGFYSHNCRQDTVDPKYPMIGLLSQRFDTWPNEAKRNNTIHADVVLKLWKQKGSPVVVVPSRSGSKVLAFSLHITDKSIKLLSVLLYPQRPSELQDHNKFIYEISRVFENMPLIRALLREVQSDQAITTKPTNAALLSLPWVLRMSWWRSAKPIVFQVQPVDSLITLHAYLAMIHQKIMWSQFLSWPYQTHLPSTWPASWGLDLH